ncbi:hypothetical protein R4B61_07460 (plasmid) [Fructilactobacillus vespulae]|uniref:hypothetical protein n=1 Tax=Fructilactobacillus vespulae TaxID=1249630 RepID=UPI0039B65FEF
MNRDKVKIGFAVGLGIMFIFSIGLVLRLNSVKSTDEYRYNELAKASNQQIQAAEQAKIKAEKDSNEKNNQTKRALAANADPKQEANQKFNDLTNKVLNNLYTFTPQNYASRKNEVKDSLSSDLYKTLYPTSKTSTNSAGTTSEFESLELFADTDPSTTKSGLAVVKYKVKSGDGDFQEHTHQWKIEYDIGNNKLTGLTDMGTPSNIGGN